MSEGLVTLGYRARILIVDDERHNRDLLKVMLTPENFQIQMAENGEAALAMIAKQIPDLILLDIMMPGMDGYQVTAKIKANEATKNIPIIMITASGDNDARIRGLTAGAEDFLTKPVNRVELSVRIRNLLRLKAYADYHGSYSNLLEEQVGSRTAELIESETRFRQLAGAIKEVFFLVNSDLSEFFYISPAFEDIWGLSCEDVYRNANVWSDAIHPEDKLPTLKKIAPDRTLIPFDTEFRIIRPDGTERSIRSRGFPIRDNAGKIYRFAGISEDITGQQLIETQLRETQKMEAIGRLSGGVAHDFNNLLTVVLGHVAVLELCEISAEAKESVAEIKRAGERAANLTRQLLLFARRQTMQQRRVDLNHTIAEIIKMLARILGEDIQLDFEPSAESLVVQADAGMLDQILMNLAVNARDAMPLGGRLVIKTFAVELKRDPEKSPKQTKEGSFALLTVGDSGTGIPPEIIAKIFDPFFTTKDVGKGTGLGLATVFGIVQQHGGWISVESNLGEGTTFSVYLPLLKDKAESGIGIPNPNQVKGGNETILLVEDEPGIRNIVQKYLGRLGYTVLSASNGSDAIKVFSEHRDEISLVMTDMIMPGRMSGVDLAKLLIAEKPGIGIIYSSGYSEVIGADDLLLKEGANFLAKPFALPRLAEIVRFQLDQRQG